mgnify:CR=1 FL=1|tara:strand:+ start:1297 stop:1860 length:564 start_codon:yes stop_codon:yes gene_type:complete
MSIVMKVGSATDEQGAPTEEPKPQASMEMVARKTLDGNIMILDHIDVDIIVIPSTNKVLTIAKGALSEDVYDTQDRLFRYLTQKGLVDPSSVRSGNVYGSMEAAYVAESYNGSDSTEVAVFTIGKFIEEERPYFTYEERHEQDNIDRLTQPDQSTELGQVPQETEKGVLPPYGHTWKIANKNIGPFS